MSCPTNLGCIPHCGTTTLPLTINTTGAYFFRYSTGSVWRWLEFEGTAGQNIQIDLSSLPIKEIQFEILDSNNIRQTFNNNGTAQTLFKITLQLNLTS